LPKFVSLTTGKGAALRELDDVISLSRLPKALNREVRMTLAQVTSVLRKPRTLYCCALEDVSPYMVRSSLLGSAAFDVNGTVAGIWLLRKKPLSASPSMEEIMRAARPIPVILPYADVLAGAAQALKNPGGQAKSDKPASKSEDKQTTKSKTSDASEKTKI
jgi:hypothetical protein